MRLSVPPSTPFRQPARPNTTSRLTDRLTARLTVKRIISSKENWPGTWKRGRSTRQLWPRLSRPSMFTTCVASCGAMCTRSISSGRCVCRHRHQLSQKPNASPTSSCRERRKRRMTRSVLYLCVCGSGWHGMRLVDSVSMYVCMRACMPRPRTTPPLPLTHHTHRTQAGTYFSSSSGCSAATFVWNSSIAAWGTSYDSSCCTMVSVDGVQGRRLGF